MKTYNNSKPLWIPDVNRAQQAQMTHFKAFIAVQCGETFADYSALHQWSVNRYEQFWQSVADFFKVIWQRKARQIVNASDEMFMTQWFPGSRLNFAQNLLRFQDNAIAIEFHNENNQQQSISYAQLYQRVAVLSKALQASGLKSGDRVAAVLPNIPEAVIAMLSCTSIGAIWSVCSPDFGEQSLVDRFAQIEATFLLFADGYYYKGKRHDILPQIVTLSNKLPGIQQLIAIPYTETECVLKKRLKQSLPQAKLLNLILQPHQEQTEIDFPPFSFSQPVYILYSSGTTGSPKCIVHGGGGTLLQHLKELGLHTDVHRSDKIFYYTSTGWMMWNWLVSGLALGATIVLYDGSPCYPEADSLLKLVARQKITVFGCSAKYLSTLQKQQVNCLDSLNHSLNLSKLRTILSTGSPLLSESFDYVYQEIKTDVQLCSISGGTDLISCFALGNPISPVYRGELQGPGLGMAVQIYNVQGQSVVNEQGELVCSTAFPSMPVFFWNDPEHKKYHKAYFEHFENVWTHGDYAKLTPNKGYIIYGRSDTTLNPGGIRIGTAEIYRLLEQLDAIADSIVVAQQWHGDQRIILFVQLQENLPLSEQLSQQIRSQIRRNCSPHHVPAKVIAVADIPHTFNGKLSEYAVTEMIHNRPVKNKQALANPDSLQLYNNLEQLKC